ncbi:MAG: OB-fold nucleic acid binding domain-containing protein [Candidatus Thermoplasmatota archaeon]
MHLKYSIIVFSCICIGLLYFFATLTEPIEIEIKHASQYEGHQVILQGIVTGWTDTKSGNQIITLSDQEENSTSIAIFLEGKTNLKYGDMIRARGKIQKYKGAYELIVNAPHALTIIQSWNNITTPIKDLALHPENYLGLNINTQGFIQQTSAHYFILADENSTYFIPVYPQNNTRSYTSGSKVSIGAYFMYDEHLLRYILTISNEQHFIIALEQ